MIYILIVLWMTSGKAAIAVEFNDVKSCEAAAARIQQQSSATVLICTPKGKP